MKKLQLKLWAALSTLGLSGGAWAAAAGCCVAGAACCIGMPCC
jgi:hypothetical protein